MAPPRRPDRVLGPYQKGGTFWLYICLAGDPDGRGPTKSSSGPWATEALALEAKKKLEKKLEGASRRTVRDAISEYKEYISRKNKEKSNAHAIWVLEDVFFKTVLDRTLLSLRERKEGKALYKLVRDHRQKNGKPYAPDSHMNFLIIARTFLRWCREEQEWISVNILEGIKGDGTRTKGQDKEQLSRDEVRRWDAVALDWAFNGKPGAVGGHRRKSREGAIAALTSFYMDLRCEEITERVQRNLDDNGRALIIADAKTDAGWRTQEIPEILQPFYAELAEGKGPFDYLYGKGKKAHTRDFPRKWVYRICSAAKVPRVSAHAMRRLHATINAERGKTAHEIALAMGHESYEVTKESYIKRGTIRKQQLSSMLDMLHGARKGPRAAPPTDGVGDGEQVRAETDPRPLPDVK